MLANRINANNALIAKLRIQIEAVPEDPYQLGLISTIYDKFRKDINKAITDFNVATTSLLAI
jgi:hypothetical protein